MEKKIVGVFKTESSAIQSIKNLKMNGYENDEISVIAKQPETLNRIEDLTDVRIEREHAAGTVTGAVAGGLIGGIGALLLELGVLAIPGVGPLFAAGPIAATLTGILAGGALGGVSGALVDMGISETDARQYENYLNEGNILVLVDERYNRDLVYANFHDNESLIRDTYRNDQI